MASKVKSNFFISHYIYDFAFAQFQGWVSILIYFKSHFHFFFCLLNYCNRVTASWGTKKAAFVSALELVDRVMGMDHPSKFHDGIWSCGLYWSWWEFERGIAWPVLCWLW
jgi:hypothetical protein